MQGKELIPGYLEDRTQIFDFLALAMQLVSLPVDVVAQLLLVRKRVVVLATEKHQQLLEYVLVAYLSDLSLSLWLSDLSRDMHREKVNEEEVRSKEVDCLSILIVELFPLMQVQFAQVFIAIIFDVVFFEVVNDFD